MAKYEIVVIVTPQKNLLSGLWASPSNPKKAVIFIHGLASSAFSLEKVISPLSGKETAVLKLQNRGHDIVSKLNKIDKRKKKGYTTAKIAGTAHEIFTECVDDIQGAVDFVKEKGIKKIFLVGHSTGCQKSIFYLSKPRLQKNIKAVILLCPVSDYSAAVHETDTKVLKKATFYAKKLVGAGKPHQLLPQEMWNEIIDAQRFLSLYTLDSEEEIFTYVNNKKIPKTYQKVKIPTLVILAGEDEYHDRPTREIVKWFRKNSRSKNLSIEVVEEASHSFNEHEKEVSSKILQWLKQLDDKI